MKKVPFVLGSVQDGVYHVVKNPMTHPVYYELLNARAPLGQHPFGLALPAHGPSDGCWGFFDGMWPDRLIEAIAAECSHAITRMPIEHPFEQMRIFNVQASPEHREHHTCYYELRTPYCVHIYGYGTDTRGGGAHANMAVRDIFSFVQSVYNVPIEQYEVPYEETAELDRKLLDLPLLA